MQKLQQFFTRTYEVQKELDLIGESRDPNQITEFLYMAFNQECHVVHFSPWKDGNFWFVITKEKSAFLFKRGHTNVGGINYPVAPVGLGEIFFDIETHYKFKIKTVRKVIAEFGSDFSRRYLEDYDDDDQDEERYHTPSSRIVFYTFSQLRGHFAQEFLKSFCGYFSGHDVKIFFDVPAFGVGMLKHDHLEFYDERDEIIYSGYFLSVDDTTSIKKCEKADHVVHPFLRALVSSYLYDGYAKHYTKQNPFYFSEKEKEDREEEMKLKR